MKDVKDIFSKQSGAYASYRPTAPENLLEYVYSKVNNFDTAWDCGTGNGQIAIKLADRFNKVYATDISREQLNNAIPHDKIIYQAERAEHTSLPDNSIDLVTVAQAVHWFDFEAYYNEVRRVAKQGAIVAIWTYYTPRISPPVNEILDDFYYNIVGDYWDKERSYIDERYQTIPFPFEELPDPGFRIRKQWTADQLLGYLGTWSSVQHYRSKVGEDPILLIKDAIDKAWDGSNEQEIDFPLYMRIGRVVK